VLRLKALFPDWFRAMGSAGVVLRGGGQMIELVAAYDPGSDAVRWAGHPRSGQLAALCREAGWELPPGSCRLGRLR
jgi:hypothetical protein